MTNDTMAIKHSASTDGSDGRHRRGVATGAFLYMVPSAVSRQPSALTDTAGHLSRRDHERQVPEPFMVDFRDRHGRSDGVDRVGYRTFSIFVFSITVYFYIQSRIISPYMLKC